MLHEYDLTQLIQPLCGWFLQNARKLPWRDDPTPYHVWVSEIMMQQTRVEAVKSYYTRFIKALPDVTALAQCEEDVYLKLWEGLGYYSRVRNLHAAAVQIMQEYDGRIPDDYGTLLKLKGIGSYTAGAIASLAYEKPEPAVDGNVLRVLARVSADDTDILDPGFKKETERLLRELLKECCSSPKDTEPEDAGKESARRDGSEKAEIPSISPRIFNQALMELGALVCVPNGAPNCEICPWRDLCLARKMQLTDKLPVRAKKKERRKEEKTILLIRDGDKIALHKRPSKGLLAGLYEFPNKQGHLSESQVISLVRDMGYSPLRIKRLADSVHIFSHVEWHMIGYSVLVEEEAFATKEQKQRAAMEELVFADAGEQKEHYALPSAFAAYRKDI